jgi:hypothetical protein
MTQQHNLLGKLAAIHSQITAYKALAVEANESALRIYKFKTTPTNPEGEWAPHDFGMTEGHGESILKEALKKTCADQIAELEQEAGMIIDGMSKPIKFGARVKK